mgnify:CR=1 FL=1
MCDVHAWDSDGNREEHGKEVPGGDSWRRANVRLANAFAQYPHAVLLAPICLRHVSLPPFPLAG